MRGGTPMAKIYISFLLNFFQPATQSRRVLNQVTDDCYLPLAELFNGNLHPKFTLSVSQSLLQLLHDAGRFDVIKHLREALKKRHIEIMHSGAHHPIFPLIEEQEVQRQLELDSQFKNAWLGQVPLNGVFSPELCYKDELVDLFRNTGFKWTVIDDQLMGMYGIYRPENEIYHIDDFYIFLRSSHWSDKLTRVEENWTGNKFLAHLNEVARYRDRDYYLILALAGETFGHHIKYYDETFLRNMLYVFEENNYDCIELCRVSDLLAIPNLGRINKQKEGESNFYFPPSSWATRPENAARGDVYPLIKSHGNAIHEKLWELTDVIRQATRHIHWGNVPDESLRVLLDKVFYSCQYFWASIWFWDPGLIRQGIDMQMRALYKCLRLTNNPELLEKGKQLYTELTWEIHKRE